VWRDQNEDGIVQLSEIQVIPGRAATPSQDFRVLPSGQTAGSASPFLGWAIRCSSAKWSGPPIWIGRCGLPIRLPLAATCGNSVGVVGAGQEFTSWVAVGVRYDLYNPDVDAYRQTPTVLVPKGCVLSHVDVHSFVWSFARNRLMLEYQHNRNALGVAADGSPTTLAADTLTLRGQMVF